MNVSDTLAAIARRVASARTVRGMGSRELARAAALSSNAVSRIEGGKTLDIQLSTLLALAAALRVRPAWLLTGEGEYEAGAPSDKPPRTPRRRAAKPSDDAQLQKAS